MFTVIFELFRVFEDFHILVAYREVDVGVRLHVIGVSRLGQGDSTELQHIANAEFSRRYLVPVGDIEDRLVLRASPWAMGE